MRTKKNDGFTLVEILIVVVILGILAAIVIPQFSQASSDAMASSLKSDLQTLRSQVALYKIQHGDDLPSTDTPADFTTNMTTVVNGQGPYLQKMPANPYIADDAAARTVKFGAVPLTVVGDGLVGWYVDTVTGIVYANDNDTAINSWEL